MFYEWARFAGLVECIVSSTNKSINLLYIHKWKKESIYEISGERKKYFSVQFSLVNNIKSLIKYILV